MTYVPYEPRPIRFHGLRESGAWRLKLYSIVYDDSPLDPKGFEPALRRAEAAQLAHTPGRARTAYSVARAITLEDVRFVEDLIRRHRDFLQAHGAPGP